MARVQTFTISPLNNSNPTTLTNINIVNDLICSSIFTYEFVLVTKGLFPTKSGPTLGSDSSVGEGKERHLILLHILIISYKNDIISIPLKNLFYLFEKQCDREGFMEEREGE